MNYRKRFCLAFAVLAGVALCAVGLPLKSIAQNPASSDAARARRSDPAPSPTPNLNRTGEITLPQDEVVRVETNLTNIFFTAADKQNRYISDLKAEDIRVLEDGAPQQIFTFQGHADLPLSLAILIDTSRSEERTLPEEKAAARTFLESVMRPDRDEAAVVSFTGDVTLEQGLTGNVARLRHAIDRVEFVPPSGEIGGGVVVVGTPPISGTNQTLAGATAIWDAIWATSNELLSGSSAEHTRRAIILLTDGEDTISQVKMDEAIARAQKADALVYAVGIGDRYHFGINEGALKRVTEHTGGRAYFPRNEKDLRDAFDQIQRDLREQYLLAYSPSNKVRDGSYRHVSIEVVNPQLRSQNLRLNYRPGYFAKEITAPGKP